MRYLRQLQVRMRGLEPDGLVLRMMYPQAPKVGHSLAEVGASLRDIADRLEEWGRWYWRRTDASVMRRSYSGLGLLLTVIFRARLPPYAQQLQPSPLRLNFRPSLSTSRRWELSLARPVRR
ncbi:MAG: winged helix-turn-helix transcriptional regulator [Pseudonocardiaceae bacterium]